MTSGADSPVVEVAGLTKVFRDFWRRPKVRAVDRLDLDIRAGEIFGLLGLLYPSSGEVRVLGRPPRDVDSKREIGYLPEESYLYHYLTPRETLDFYGRLFDLDRRTRRDRVEQLLEMVGLTAAAGRPVGEFSKGMARRVGLAQALINDPRLIVLDEPTAGLDPIGCRQVKDLMLALAARGKTILLSSHLLADVEDVCSQVAILYNGRVRARGSIRELLVRQDRIRLNLPVLPPEQMERLLAGLRNLLGRDVQPEHPSLTLEEFFLQVVEKANVAAETPTGAARSTGLAPYLTSRT